jgi:hypothetical protein
MTKNWRWKDYCSFNVILDIVYRNGFVIVTTLIIDFFCTFALLHLNGNLSENFDSHFEDCPEVHLLIKDWSYHFLQSIAYVKNDNFNLLWANGLQGNLRNGCQNSQTNFHLNVAKQMYKKSQ